MTSLERGDISTALSSSTLTESSISDIDWSRSDSSIFWSLEIRELIFEEYEATLAASIEPLAKEIISNINVPEA